MIQPPRITTCYRVFGKFATICCGVLDVNATHILIRMPAGDEWVKKGDNIYATQEEANAALHAAIAYRSHH